MPTGHVRAILIVRRCRCQKELPFMIGVLLNHAMMQLLPHETKRALDVQVN